MKYTNGLKLFSTSLCTISEDAALSSERDLLNVRKRHL